MITISSMRLLSVQDKTVCGAQEFVGNGSVFSANVNQLVMNLSVEAPKFDGFSVGSVNHAHHATITHCPPKSHWNQTHLDYSF